MLHPSISPIYEMHVAREAGEAGERPIGNVGSSLVSPGSEERGRGGDALLGIGLCAAQLHYFWIYGVS